MNIAASQRAFERLGVTPLTPAIGAEISGIDLSQEQDGAGIPGSRAALPARQGVFFRNHPLSPAPHKASAPRSTSPPSTHAHREAHPHTLARAQSAGHGLQ
ncbi:MAG: TauD/TfdA family dioxygenase, partial [Sphingopyxis sp.]|nr:TauD/TfdA family dioxygenase [Sphingopyxis sp.]